MIEPAVVARESAAWVWYPDDAEVVTTSELVLARWPSYVASPPTLLRFAPTPEGAQSLERVVGQARAWGADDLLAWVRLDAPAGFEEELRRRRGDLHESVDVFALDLSARVPDLEAPDVELRWRDATTSRDFVDLGIAAFGEGAVPDEETLRRQGEEAEQDRLAGRGAQLIAYVGGRPVGAAGLTMAGATVRRHRCDRGGVGVVVLTGIPEDLLHRPRRTREEDDPGVADLQQQ